MFVRFCGVCFKLPPVVLLSAFLVGIIWSWQQTTFWMFPPVPSMVALPFLVVGSLLWYLGHQRVLARLFFGHCAAVVACVLVLPLAATCPTIVLLLVLVAIMCLFHVVWFLPHHYLAMLAEEHPRRYRRWYLIHILTDLGGGLGGLCVLLATPLAARWMEGGFAAGLLLYLIVGGCWGLAAYRGTDEPQEREQLRLIGSGILVAILLPLLFLGLPYLFHRSGREPWLALLTLPLLPLVVGYAMLRFQLLVPDRTIRRTALWMARGLVLPLLMLLLVGSSLMLARGPMLALVLALGLTVLGPLVWWGTEALIARLFTSELPSLKAFLQEPPAVASLEEAAALLGSAISLASGSRQVCLCQCLDGARVFAPLPGCTSPNDPRRHLLQRVQEWWGPGEAPQPFLILPEELSCELETHAWVMPVCEQEHVSSVPAWLRWMAPQRQARLLAFPVRAHDARLCALLLLGPAEHGQPYTGADLERILQVVERASGWLSDAQQREETRRQDRLLGQIYSGLASLPLTAEPRVVVAAYAELMASLGASLDVRWSSQAGTEETWLRVGDGPWLSPDEREQLEDQYQDAAHFLSSGDGPWSCAVACFSLAVGSAPVQLIMTYPHPYHFWPREQEYWQIVVRHCQDRLETMMHQIISAEKRAEEAQLLTVLAGSMDLLLQEDFSDDQRTLLLASAHQSAQQLREAYGR